MFSLTVLAVAGCSDTPGGPVSPVEQGRPARYTPSTRIYYIAAEDVDWNYAPLDSDPVFSRPLPEPWGVQTVYPKQRYVQYTDGTFTTTVPQPACQGILGPMIRGVVGDTIKVVFHNPTQGRSTILPAAAATPWSRAGPTPTPGSSGQRRAAMKVGDMVADNPGTWLLHCHVADHMMAGMYTLFTVGGGTPLAAQVARDPGSGWSAFHDRESATAHR